MSKVIVIRNWEQFQHYRDRSAPWVKLYRDLLTSESWVLGTDCSRLVQVASVLLAVRYGNQTPLNYPLLKRVASLDCSEKEFLAAIAHLSKDFLEIQTLPNGVNDVEQLASTPLATCTSEESRGEESRGEQRRGARGRARDPAEVFAPHKVPGLDVPAWTDWVGYRAKRKPAIKPESMAKAAQAMASLGERQRAAVDHSIANGYQGLIEPKDGPNGRRDAPRKTRYEQAAEHLDRLIAEDEAALEGDARAVRPAVDRDLRPGANGDLEFPDRSADGRGAEDRAA